MFYKRAEIQAQQGFFAFYTNFILKYIYAN